MNTICKTLCHMTPEEKHIYNVNYYKQHKEKWKMYNRGVASGSIGADIFANQWDNDKRKMDSEIANIQAEQQRRLEEMRKNDNKSIDELFSEQVVAAKKYFKSNEFKKQLKTGVNFLKKHSGEMVGLAKEFAKSFFGALRSK